MHFHTHLKDFHCGYKQICFPNYSTSLANICCPCYSVPVNYFQLFYVLFLAKIAGILLGNKTFSQRPSLKISTIINAPNLHYTEIWYY